MCLFTCCTRLPPPRPSSPVASFLLSFCWCTNLLHPPFFSFSCAVSLGTHTPGAWVDLTNTRVTFFLCVALQLELLSLWISPFVRVGWQEERITFVRAVNSGILVSMPQERTVHLCKIVVHCRYLPHVARSTTPPQAYSPAHTPPPASEIFLLPLRMCMFLPIFMNLSETF